MKTAHFAYRFTAAALCAMVSSAIGCSVDETGYLVPPKIYTTVDPSASSPAPGYVVGLDGAITDPGGTLTIDNPRTQQKVSKAINDKGGSFVAEMDLRRGDDLHLTYALDGNEETIDVLVGDQSGAEAPPTPCTTCEGSFITAPDASGRVLVSLNALDMPVPPYVVFDVRTGELHVASDLATPVAFTAIAGDSICMFRLADPATSAPFCLPVPAL